MKLACDTSAIMAVVLNEPAREQLREKTHGAELVAPASLPWEIGNALSAGFKKGRLSLPMARKALDQYQRHIPIRLVPVALQAAVELAAEFDLYAYDAYVLACARSVGCPLLTLDSGQRDAAERAGVDVVYIQA